MRYLVTGGAGFIGSHMVDRLVADGHDVIVVDDLSSGFLCQVPVGVKFYKEDITDYDSLAEIMKWEYPIDGIFHYAALARTPWCINDPLLCAKINVLGTINVLELARQWGVKRTVLSSSNVVLAFNTPYRASKEDVEKWCMTYKEMYGLSCIALRYSNVYGPRQSELGPSPNVFAALRMSKKANGYLTITGDGEQSRDYTHVSDIVEGGLLAMESDYCGVVDLCTGINTSLNTVAKFFGCPVKYIDDRPGDIKHIRQDPKSAKEILGWEAKVKLEDGIIDVL